VLEGEARRHRDAHWASRAASGVAACGLASAALPSSAAVHLAVRWVGSALAAEVIGAGTAALFAVVWFVLPVLLNRDG
jgi:hypothetical protein